MKKGQIEKVKKSKRKSILKNLKKDAEAILKNN